MNERILQKIMVSLLKKSDNFLLLFIFYTFATLFSKQWHI
ncbi:hypothetical protein NC99_31270 [Sunxiuqinia dokdonensis]|uniref:Uncharacterized protein n=1 Tax=Sunxiuqinia dokdonensis TaxID=1409788 RepID=A0A0L8V6T2_9BACT|nr:hypothetical protein NC99_31270 [Sunxiuqinia dokdonensis]